MGLDANWLKLLSALVVAVFLGIPTWNDRYAKLFKDMGRGSGRTERGGID